MRRIVQCTNDKVVERLVHLTIMTSDQPGDGLPQLLVADEHQGKGKARQPPCEKKLLMRKISPSAKC